jgi:hypothetical protein
MLFRAGFPALWTCARTESLVVTNPLSGWLSNRLLSSCDIFVAFSVRLLCLSSELCACRPETLSKRQRLVARSVVVSVGVMALFAFLLGRFAKPIRYSSGASRAPQGISLGERVVGLWE